MDTNNQSDEPVDINSQEEELSQPQPQVVRPEQPQGHVLNQQDAASQPLDTKPPTAPQGVVPSSPEPQIVVPNGSAAPGVDTTGALVEPQADQPQAEQPQPATSATPSVTTAAEQSSVSQPTATLSNEPTNVPPKKRNKKLFLFGVLALLVLTAVGVFFALKVTAGNVKLTTYNGNKYSIRYPEGYQVEEMGEVVTFTEQLPAEDETADSNEASNETLSAVQVYYLEIPATLTDEQRALLKENVSTFSDYVKQASANDEEDKLVNEEVTEIDFLGVKSEKMVGEIEKNGVKHSDIYLVSSLTDKSFVVIAVSAHTSDSGVADKAADIVNSFTLK